MQPRGFATSAILGKTGLPEDFLFSNFQKVLLIGGYDGDNNMDTTHLCDAQHCDTAVRLPAARWLPAAAAAGGRVWMVGGDRAPGTCA